MYSMLSFIFMIVAIFIMHDNQDEFLGLCIISALFGLAGGLYNISDSIKQNKNNNDNNDKNDN